MKFIWAGLLVIAACCAPCASAAPITGSWIWSSSVSTERNAHTFFRRTFNLSSNPLTGSVRIAADSRYILYINGNLVGRGSTRSFARNLYFDTWDVLPYLRRGMNIVSVHVHHYGEATGQYQPGRPGLLMDLIMTQQRGGTSVRSDDTWKVLPAASWDRRQSRMSSSLGFPEIYDARKEPTDWTALQFDDSDWLNATVLGPVGMAPWTNLTPGDARAPTQTSIKPRSVVWNGIAIPPPDAAKLDFSSIWLDSRSPIVCYASTWLYSPGPRTVTLLLGMSESGKVWLNNEMVLYRADGRISATRQERINLVLPTGWSRLLLKSVKISQRWNVRFCLTGDAASGIVVSSERDVANPNTWRVSPIYDVADGLDRTALNTEYPPETQLDTSNWKLLTLPPGPYDVVATQMRYTRRVEVGTDAVPGAYTLMGEPPASASFRSTSDGDGSLLLDFGKEVFGRPRISISSASGGEVVDLGYGEATEYPDGTLMCPRVGVGVLNPERDDVRYADRFICKPGTNVFTTFEKRAMRYLQIEVHNAPTPVTVTGLTVVVDEYPADALGTFSSSDDMLNRIWEMGRYTLALNMDDTFTDCPWRERNQWVGDAVIESWVASYAFGDSQLFRKMLLHGAQSQTTDGLVQGVYPTGWENFSTRLPSYSLQWITAVYDYYRYTGDASLLLDMLPVIDGVFANLQKSLNPQTGLLENVPDWVFVDWAPGLSQQNEGISGPLNCFYYNALRSAARIALVCQDVVRATRYSRQSGTVASSINRHLWDVQAGIYRDSIVNGVRGAAASQQMNSLAISFGIAPPDKWAGIANRMLNDETMTRIGTPYFGKFYLDALHAAGKHQEALDFIRTRWGHMVEWGSATAWEGWHATASLCHGWSVAPTADLMAWVLGIRPVSPGWDAWEMAPVTCDVTSASGVVPTPHGMIEASWNRASDGFNLTVTVPEGTTARIRIPAEGYETAHLTVNGAATLPAGTTLEIKDGHRVLSVRAAGAYLISATNN